jgi:hypothetical protein
VSDFVCEICNKEFKRKQHLENHNKKKYSCLLNKNKTQNNSKNLKNQDNQNNQVNEKKNICNYCKKPFTRIDNLTRHIDNRCKVRKRLIQDKAAINKQTDELKNQNIELISHIKTLTEIYKENNETQNKKLDKIVVLNNISDSPINYKLIKIICENNKKISELENKETKETRGNNNNNINNNTNDVECLVLNNISISLRVIDNFINAQQLCRIENKNFNEWLELESTTNLICFLSTELGIAQSQLFDIKTKIEISNNQEIWIHPDLAIQLAQWISPVTAFHITKWIREIISNNKNITNILKDKDQEIISKNNEIKLLMDTYVKKQKRDIYPDANVVYLITNNYLKKDRIYIIGKATNLTFRLGVYNKSSEHEVIYYKKCNSIYKMKLTEDAILNKLNEYREKANRDRFILPIEKNIDFFTNVVDECVNFFN